MGREAAMELGEGGAQVLGEVWRHQQVPGPTAFWRLAVNYLSFFVAQNEVTLGPILVSKK